MCDTNQVGPVPNVDFKLLKISCHEQTLNGYQGIRRHKSFVFPSAKTCMFFCWASQQATECKHSTWTFVVFLSSSVRDISKDILKNHKDQREGVPAWGLSYCSGSQLPMTTTKQQGPGWWISTGKFELQCVHIQCSAEWSWYLSPAAAFSVAADAVTVDSNGASSFTWISEYCLLVQRVR